MSYDGEHRRPRSRQSPLALVAVIALVLGTGALFVAANLAPTGRSLAAEGDVLSVREECQQALTYPGRTNADRDWLRKCVHALATPTVAPTAGPTPTVAPTPTPAPSPTVGPTTPAPTTPAPTTPPPTTPPPSPTPAPTAGCMPVPSACGYPDTTNTGVRFIGPLPVINGNVTLSTAGMTYERKDVRGCISVRARNVVIRDVKVSCSSWYPIAVNSGSGNIWVDPLANLTVEDVEINHLGRFDGKGIAFDGYTARRIYYHNGADCAHMEHNVLVEDSYCVLGPDGATNRDWCHMQIDGGEPHWDGFQSDGGDNIVIRHNTVRNPCQQTSAILISTNTAPIGNVTIERNLMAGGGWTVYCGTSEGGFPFGSNIFRDNRIARSFYTWPFGEDHENGDVGGYYGPMTSCRASNIAASGNVWDETSTLIPLQ